MQSKDFGEDISLQAVPYPPVRVGSNIVYPIDKLIEEVEGQTERVVLPKITDVNKRSSINTELYKLGDSDEVNDPDIHQCIYVADAKNNQQ